MMARNHTSRHGLSGFATLLIALLCVAAKPGQRLHPLLGELASSLPETLQQGAAEANARPAAKVDNPRFPFLPDDPESGSFSVGTTSHGHLVRSKKLKEDSTLGILAKQRRRNLRYGTEELVATIQHAAVELYRETKTRLWVGNLGRRRGGDISYSVSHNSGRDADIAFAYQDLLGQPVDAPSLVPLNGQGIASKYGLKFDVARTWLIVRGLLKSPSAQVQYLFISRDLREMLLMHAKRKGEPAPLIMRAADVLRQPSGSAPHNDHLHLRIYCSERDVSGGCIDGGATYSWTKSTAAARVKRSHEVAAFLNHQNPKARRNALDRLVLLRAKEHLRGVRESLADSDPDVRMHAAGALAELGKKADAHALAARFAIEPDASVRIALLFAAARLPGPAAGRLLANAVGSAHPVPAPGPSLEAAESLRGPALLGLLAQQAPLLAPATNSQNWTMIDQWFGGTVLEQQRQTTTLQLAAIGASAQAERLEPAERLVGLLDDADPQLRARAADALRMITNFAYGIDFNSEDPLMLAKGRDRWRSAWRRSKTASRKAWLQTGFQAAGYKIKALNRKSSWELVRAIVGSDHLSFNAQRSLMRITKHYPPTLSWSKNDACKYWLRWLKGRRRRLRIKLPSDKVTAACYAPAR